MTPDAKRVYDGFSTLEMGVNAAMAPSLIPANQCAAARDFTFRDGFIKTRAPWSNLVLTFDSPATQANFTGNFQGSCDYKNVFGEDGFVISVSGRLFILTLGLQNVIKEITPKITIVTVEPFTVPGMGSTVSAFVNSSDLISFGDTVYIDSGQYTVTSISGDELLLDYVSGAANAIAAPGNSVLDSSQNLIIEYELNPAGNLFVDLFQAENYVIVLSGQESPIIFDGAQARRAGIGELPAGVFGIYLWGRIWIVLNDFKSTVAGDLVGDASGTSANGYRDAILKMTENSFLNEGGAFTMPSNSGPITGLAALATQDTSLGVGNLLVGTVNSVVSLNTPVDRTTWKNLTYPIQTISLIDYGPLGPRSIVQVNGDIWYRSVDGIRSFIVARRAMGTWGNTPMSREVNNIIKLDDESLLPYGSGVMFDNRLLMTVSPFRCANGIAHRGLVCINYDLLSTLQGSQSPAWEGLISGVNILQILKGNVGNQERCFAFASTNGVIEFWELNKTGYYDQYTTVSNGHTSIARKAIQPTVDTRSYSFGNSAQRKRLYTCEIYLDELVDNVSITLKYRPDQYPGWATWTTVNFCANVTQCTVQTPGEFSCQVFKTQGAQYAARVMLTRPPELCNPISGKQFADGYEFQFRIEGSGHFRIRKFQPHAVIASDTTEGECPSTPVCQAVQDCGTNWFDYSATT